MDKFLIKNTTRAQREQIVRNSLGYDDIGCESEDGYDMYKPYIDGEMEISDITQAYRVSYVSYALDDPRNGKCRL